VNDVNASDQALIDRCLEGQTDAFGELVTRHQDRLYGTLVNMLGSVHDARDATQDAFVLAFQKLETFRRESAFYSWLFRIAYNAAVSRHRKTRRETGSVEAARAASGREPTDERPQADPAHDLYTAERQNLVQSALGELADEYRTVIVLREMEGLSYEQIAELVGVPIGTVRSRIHRARTELRDKLSRAMAAER
jgi:RNA polymerase sigma-70 factor, ECF subfamily